MIDTLSKLIAEFERNELDFSRNRAADDDLLGDAYEYLMKNFAAESGKSKGQFYTPAEVSRVIAKVLHLEELDKRSYSIYDPTCGSGSLLLRALAETPRGVSLRGQEKDSTTASLAKLNMLLHGIINARIEIGDTLNNPKFTSGGTLETFDVCIANPPFSQKNWLTLDGDAGGENDRYHRWSETMLPPAKCGDYAFLLHLISSMAEGTGRGACILPLGVLFRGNAEYAIRKHIIDEHYIKGVIGLPANIFFGTGIPASILIIDKKDKDTRQGIFFIDAKDGYMKDGAKNRLREQDIKRIVDTWNAQRDVPHYAKFVSYKEICNEKNDYNLNITRYIIPEDKEIQHDINAHLHGGIPAYDVEKMQHYWSVCSGLKDAMFAKIDGNYYALKPQKGEIVEVINTNEGFIAQSQKFTHTINTWIDYAREQMYAVNQGSIPKELIKEWSEKLLEIAKADDSLEDAYQIYDILMNYWQETMQDDCYMISNDGWTYPEVKAIKRTETFSKKKKVWTIKETKCTYADIVCDLLPVEIILSVFFEKELEVIDTLQSELDMVNSQRDELVEDNQDAFTFSDQSDSEDDGDDDAEIKVNEADVKKEINFAKANHGDPESLALWEEWITINIRSKAIVKKLSGLRNELTKNVVSKYMELQPEEIRSLVIDKKWIPALSTRFTDDMQRIVHQISADVISVTERYESTLSQIDEEVIRYEAKVKSHLETMGFEL